MAALPIAEIERLLQPYKVTIPSDMADKVRIYVEILMRWNRTISLTAVTEPSEIVKFHFGESLFAISEVNFEQSRLADVGTGAGFPGLPLAMAVPGLTVALIESNSKKCAFLAEVIRELKIANANVFRGRMEDYSIGLDRLDLVTARALGHHEELLKWSAKRLSAGGKVILWIGEDDAVELESKTQWIWRNRVLIPDSKRRYVLIGSPKS